VYLILTMNQHNIKTIILCGGTGTRLKEETEFKPKPMVEIGGKPILWHIMKTYAHFGYHNFILALGYKGDYIKDYFLRQQLQTKFLQEAPAQAPDGFNILFGETGLETPHGERVLKLKEYITEDIFMVTYGDGVADIDIAKLVAFHKAHGKIATITGVHPESRWGLVNTNSNNVITEFAQKPMLYDYVNGGFMVFNRTIFDYLKPGDMIEDPLKLLIPLGQAVLYKHEGFWYGMDTHKDFLHLNELWKNNPKWKVWGQKGDAKTVLVTGGAGFIGSNLVNELVMQNNRVVVVDDLSSGKKEQVHPAAIFYQADVRSQQLKEIMAKENPAVVYHFAAKPIVEDVYKNPAEAIDVNVMGTVNVLEACRQQKNLEAVIVVSSDKAYGKAHQLPYQETTPLKGDHPYDVSKSSADLIAQTYAVTYGLPVLITRFSNVFGPGDANMSRIIPGIIESIVENKELQIRSDGTMVREYTYVKDIVQGCIQLANHKKDFGQAFNFGSKNVLSVLDIIKKSEEALGTKINYKILNTAKNEIPAQYLDWSKAQQVLGWQPQVPLEHGIQETFKWFKDTHFAA